MIHVGFSPLNLILLKKGSSEVIFSHERYCFGVFTLLGSQQYVFLWFGYSGKRRYSFIRKKAENEEENNAESRVHFICEHQIVLVSRELMLVQ